MTQEDLNKGFSDVTQKCKHCGRALVFRNSVAYCNNKNCNKVAR